jgi:hypothetical protein
MPIKKALFVVLAAGALSACGQKTEPPSETGMALGPEQIVVLNADRSLADKRVSVVGFPMLCSGATKHRSGDVVDVEIHTEQNCRSPQLASAKLTLSGEKSANPGFGATGNKPRNRLLAGDAFSNDTITFLTDDYKVTPVTAALRVTGLVTYPYGTKNNTPVLDGVPLNSASGS